MDKQNKTSKETLLFISTWIKGWTHKDEESLIAWMEDAAKSKEGSGDLEQDKIVLSCTSAYLD